MRATTAVLILLPTLLVVTGLAWLALDRLDRLQDLHADLKQELEDTIAGATDLIVEVAPLIEQTDWMTGRWGGKFDQLVALEKQRNEAVVNARKAMNEIPFVQKQTLSALPEGLSVFQFGPLDRTLLEGNA